MTRLSITSAIEVLPLSKPFRISGYAFSTASVLVVTVSDGRHRGRGEASGVYYLGDDASTMLGAVGAAQPAIERGLTRQELRQLMPPGGARNAIDAALWELEARQRNVPVWELAGLPRPRALLTCFTLGADAPSVMQRAAAALVDARALKLKLTGELDQDVARIRAVRRARPDCWIGVDANQGFDYRDLPALIDVLVEADVRLLEQPLRRGCEQNLEGLMSPIPIAADESVLSLADVATLPGRFDVVNIKLDKCGGLTEGLMMAEAARSLGLKVMVGNMVGSSLAMAPAFILGQLCDFVDLDGPTFLAADRSPSIRYAQGEAWCGEEVWGREHAASSEQIACR